MAETVTIEQIRGEIVSTFYFTAYEGVLGERFNHEGPGDNDKDEGDIPDPLKLMTICVLVLKNGFTVLGKSACADPAKYNKGIGQKTAYDDAFNQIWTLLGYELRTKLFLQAEGPAKRAAGERQADGPEAVSASSIPADAPITTDYSPEERRAVAQSPFKKSVDPTASNTSNPYNEGN